MDQILAFCATAIGSLLIGAVVVFGVAFFVFGLLSGVNLCFTPEMCGAAP